MSNTLVTCVCVCVLEPFWKRMKGDDSGICLTKPSYAYLYIQLIFFCLLVWMSWLRKLMTEYFACELTSRMHDAHPDNSLTAAWVDFSLWKEF
jgi:hypothetical protein